VRCLLLADLHGNLPALEAVLADAGPVDAVWCLGDVVGLGADPEGCVARLRSLAAPTVAGNHDRAVVGRPGPEFRAMPFLGESNAWTRRRLSSASLDYLAGLPERLDVEGIRLLHDQGELSGHERVALVGHTHLPLMEPPGAVPRPGEPLSLAAGSVLNPGPVGASDWRPGWASYALLEVGRAVEATTRVVPAPAGPDEAELPRLDAPPRLAAYWRRLAADAARAWGDLERARALFRLSAAVLRDGRDGRQALHLLVGLADLVAAEGDGERAAALLGAAMPDPATAHPAQRHRVALASAALQRGLGEDPFEAARRRGAGLGIEAAVALGRL
jgi:predicted phosphodiesterase